MSFGPSPSVEAQSVVIPRMHVRAGLELMELSKQELPPIAYYREFLQLVQRELSAVASTVWEISAQGHLQIQFQIDFSQLEINQSEASRQSHEGLLRQIVAMGHSKLFPAQSDGETANGAGADNPTALPLLLAPVVIDKQVVGLVEVWLDALTSRHSQQGFLTFLDFAAGQAADYLRHQRNRRPSEQQQLWSKFDAFSRQIHSSLDPIKVAYLVANEGRNLIECDRLSVAHLAGKQARVAAISGADVIEKRSVLVRSMTALFERVLTWNRNPPVPLVYTGTRDDALPAAIWESLDAFLAESKSRMLAVLPLRDERENDKNPCRSALMLECFEVKPAPDQLVERLEVVGKHATSAMYNALEHRRIPMRWIWQPLASVQEGLGGKTKVISASIAVAVFVLLMAMIFVPYPLKMDAKGQLLPQTRAWIFPPVEGHVVRFEVDPGMDVLKDQSLVLMHDTNLGSKLIDLNKEIDAADKDVQASAARFSEAAAEADRLTISTERRKQEAVRDLKIQQRNYLRNRTHSEESTPGNFWIKSPMDGTILNFDFREKLANKFVRPSDPLLRIGDQKAIWEIELKIPQKHIGQILLALDNPALPMKELDVDLLLLADPTRTFKGKLARDRIAREANSNREETEESEPFIAALVRIDGDDIDPAGRLPRNLLLTDTMVHAKVRCGNRAMGYSLFYGVWEFLYEKVIFFF